MNLRIRNFKCFYDIDIPLGSLTILAGKNGSGKSTVIQSLLLLRRTIEHCGVWKSDHFEYNEINSLNVELNGPYCMGLGSSINILPIHFQDSKVHLGLHHGQEEFTISYETNKGDELWITPEMITNKLAYPENFLLPQEFYYLNAERIGPRISQNIKFYDYYNVGSQGEFTAQIICDIDTLETDTKFIIDHNRILDESVVKGNKFQHHVNAWLNFILEGVSILPIKDHSTHTARILVENFFSRGNPTFPTNTGFGISYSLPIIVSCLLAKNKRVMIVENPEAHLHPSAQSRMGYFLGIMANSGVIIIVETHSDHIINGVQKAIAKKKINSENVIINYFFNEEKTPQEIEEEKMLGREQQPMLRTLRMDPAGQLSEWPRGFFDQTQIDYIDLLEIRRNLDL
ncbi:hypothetical protein HQ45_00535 [Porphyromonas crevioricanis]|uniref:AAA family ATPase n=1 Tax=Porphyromonas crevioricanis TaxID=393921 RepID=UPI00052D9E5A|nr:DUF3696 domain-containing protein [Porphyromonas crevioricanis]KGN91300.1 hypothetical protein HQ45_00535 [Porphyromonas crevioricanis]